MSERGIHADVKTEIQGVVVHPIILCEMGFPSATVNTWTGQGSISWDSKTWTGTGELIGFSSFPERMDGSAQGIQMTVNGVDSTLLSDATEDEWQGAAVGVWIAFVDTSGAIIGDPFKMFGGLMDTAEIYDDGERATITINAESRLIDQLRTIQYRYTDQDQQKLYAGDKGFEFIAGISDRQAVWQQ